MPRYFFHTQEFADQVGTELADLNAARTAALMTLSEILPEMEEDLWGSGAVRLTVTDERGSVLLTIESKATAYAGERVPVQAG